MSAIVWRRKLLSVYGYCLLRIRNYSLTGVALTVLLFYAGYKKYKSYHFSDCEINILLPLAKTKATIDKMLNGRTLNKNILHLFSNDSERFTSNSEINENILLIKIRRIQKNSLHLPCKT